MKKWLRPGLGVKRWLFVATIGFFLLGIGIVSLLDTAVPETLRNSDWLLVVLLIGGGIGLAGISLIQFSNNLLAPYRKNQRGRVVDTVYSHTQRGKGLKFVAIGGGTGLPVILQGMKSFTGNITAIVTVADDGGSSGRLRRDMGILPPGDLRNNIAALADDKTLLTRLFQYRFQAGDLQGHAFGNLFIVALADIVKGESGTDQNSLAEALTEVERILNISGRVLPSTLDDVTLHASVRMANTSHVINIVGESSISELGGDIERIEITPENATAYPESVQAILNADLVVIGPGSLYTSILPNLMVSGIADALRATSAYKIYICNVATQPGETTNYTVAEHVLALERHIGRGVFQVVLANNRYPTFNQGITEYVIPAPPHHEISHRYEIQYTDLTDEERPWRHDSAKLVQAILRLSQKERFGETVNSAII